MRATTCDVAGPPSVQREGYTISSPVHSPANTASLRCSSSGAGAARWSGIDLSSLYRLDDFLRGIVEIVGRQHVEAAFPDDLLAGIDIGAFQPHHQGNLEAGFLDRRDHALGNDVAFHDATENVDQDALHVGIGGDDLERRGDLGLVGAAAYVEEVRRRHSVKLDDVHGGHREAGAVDHTPDVAVERDIVEIVFGSLDLLC